MTITDHKARTDTNATPARNSGRAQRALHHERALISSLSLTLTLCLSVWLAVVSGVAFQHTGKAATTRGGVKLVKNGWYLSVKFYERSPATSSDTFLLDNDSDREMVIDAEGVIFTSNQSSALQPVRAQR